jgi:hypothetical protein
VSHAQEQIVRKNTAIPGSVILITNSQTRKLVQQIKTEGDGKSVFKSRENANLDIAVSIPRTVVAKYFRDNPKAKEFAFSMEMSIEGKANSTKKGTFKILFAQIGNGNAIIVPIFPNVDVDRDMVMRMSGPFSESISNIEDNG